MFGERSVSRRSLLASVGTTGAAIVGGALALGDTPGSTASDWLQRGYDAGRTNFKSDGSPPLEGGTVEWRRSIPLADTDGLSGSPPSLVLVLGDSVYTQAGVYDLATGDEIGRPACLQGSIVALGRTETYPEGVVTAAADRRLTPVPFVVFVVAGTVLFGAAHALVALHVYDYVATVDSSAE